MPDDFYLRLVSLSKWLVYKYCIQGWGVYLLELEEGNPSTPHMCGRDSCHVGTHAAVYRGYKDGT